MKRIVLSLIFVFFVAANAHALSVTWDETDDGDLSNDHLNPTFVTLFPEASKVLAMTTFDPLDRDFLFVTVPDGSVLDEIIWGLYESDDDQSFFAVQEGNQISSITDASALLGTALVGSDELATNVLDDLGDASLGGIGFTGSLGPGDYTFWFQETAADVAYGYTFVLRPTNIPEPTMAIVPAIGGLVVLSRRRRNR